MWIGDFTEDFTAVTCMFTTHSSSGAPVAPSSGFEAADVTIYKNGNAAQKTTTNGVTMTSPFDSITGLHCLTIDTSNDTGDSGFWVAGAVYTLVLSPDETVDSVAVAKVIGQFGIELAGALRPTTAGRKLDVDASGGAEVGSFQTGAITSAAFAAGAIDNAAIATDAIGSAELASSAISEIQSGLSTLDAAGVRTAVGLASANLDTQLSGINSKTTNLPSDPADASDIVSSFSTVNSTLSTIAGYIDTEVAAIKAKTDNLPASPAATGDIPSAATVAGAVWDEATSGHATAGTFGLLASDTKTDVAAIKAKTDELSFTVSGEVDANIQSVNDVTVNGDGSGTPWGP